MDRQDEETRVWPSVDTDPPADDDEPSDAPLSLWARLWDFFTVEVPDEPDLERSEIPSPRVRTPLAGVSVPAHDAAGTERGTPEATIPEANEWQRTPPPHRRSRGRSLRHSRLASRLAWQVRRHRWAAGSIALVGVAVVALIATHAGGPRPHATVGQAARPAAHAPARPGRAAPSPAPHGQAAPSPAAGSTPDCASMGMQSVASPGSSTSPSVPGLCFSLGGGSGWLIGCAPGFQTACDPSLQTVIACVRQDGARHRGIVTDADVRACDGAAAGAARATRTHPVIPAIG